MNCEQAQQLFDAYLDGELSAMLKTELGAHCVQCADCRRAMALIQVSGHILNADRDPVELGAGFSDRLIACVDSREKHWTVRFRRWAYVGGPMAAAAVILLAFMGTFDRGGTSQVAGRVDKPLIIGSAIDEIDESLIDSAFISGEENDPAIQGWFDQVETNLKNKRGSGEQLQESLNLTILQMIDILDKADESVPSDSPRVDPNHKPASDKSKRPANRSDEDVEDL